ncbi:hypothetical protein P4V00_10125, partial [Brevibacillus agri]|nr:hypothetical protein [Brevibacillus agri]
YKKVKNYARGRSSTFNGEELFLTPFPKISLKKVDGKHVVAIFVEVSSELICGLDKNGEKYVVIRTNNRSVVVKDPHQIGEIYVKRKLGSEISRRLGLL